MGKHKHSKDKLWLNPAEYAECWGGFTTKNLPFKKLPLHCCALSLQKFESPVCTKNGEVFEATNVIPFIKAHGKNPVTGEPLHLKDLTALKFQKRDEKTDTFDKKQQNNYATYVDPVFPDKQLSENLHVVCNLKSGHVYLFDTVSTMNKKANNFHDLVTGEKFVWSTDIVTLQDPSFPEKRDVQKFWHVREGIEFGDVMQMVEKGIEEGLKKVLAGAGAEGGSSSSSSTDNAHKFINLNESLKSALDAQKKRVAEVKQEQSAKRQKEEARKTEIAEREKARTVNKFYTSGAASRGFTSTRMDAASGNNQYRLNTDKEERELLYEKMKKRQKNVKGYVKLNLGIARGGNGENSNSRANKVVLAGSTLESSSSKSREAIKLRREESNDAFSELGSVNVELHADVTPHAVDNFLRHCESGYYDNTVFHRLVPNFVIQGGDPTGTGTGGQSAFDDGACFKDEIDSRLQFEKKGCLAMANPGLKDENKSQFFITLRDDLTSVLFKKHTCFGRIVGGMNLLEQVTMTGESSSDLLIKTDKRDRPLRDIVILSTEVFSNPFKECIEAIAKEEKELEKKRGEMWFNNAKDVMAEHENRNSDEIGKYAGTSISSGGGPGGGGGKGNKINHGGTSGTSILDALLAESTNAEKDVATLQKTLAGMSKEEREYAAAGRKRREKKAFTFDDW